VRSLLAIAAGACLLLCASAASAQDSIPASTAARSLALAQQVWHPANCPTVSLKSYRAGDAAAEDDVDSALGFALEDQCQIEINWPLVKQYADSDVYIVDVQRTRQIWACTVIVHEIGHLSGYTDPVGAPILDASGNPIYDDFSGQMLRDTRHSPNPHNVMYPYLRYTYAPCRSLFKAKKAGHLRPDAATR
jgi:hypothetical protein